MAESAEMACVRRRAGHHGVCDRTVRPRRADRGPEDTRLSEQPSHELLRLLATRVRSLVPGPEGANTAMDVRSNEQGTRPRRHGPLPVVVCARHYGAKWHLRRKVFRQSFRGRYERVQEKKGAASQTP